MTVRGAPTRPMKYLSDQKRRGPLLLHLLPGLLHGRDARPLRLDCRQREDCLLSAYRGENN